MPLRFFPAAAIVLTTLISISLVTYSHALDPCGMVPPIYTGQSPIARKGLQETYVFHRNGVESFMIRPGYEGNIDNFGMLIPFPSPPSIRKVHDDIFEHVKNAIDPPEVVIDLNPIMLENNFAMDAAGAELQWSEEYDEDQVVVLRQEAVGMYEVAVLAAGSADALKKWMDENGYQFPDGMEPVAGEYIEEGWCFVAVKTKVSSRDSVEPTPGQQDVNPGLPEGSVFEGQVQGLAFRFPTEELVVPMRLSAFNVGDLRNVVYLLTDGAKRIRNIPEEYVRRQVSGRQLAENITRPVPLRILGGTIDDLDAGRLESLRNERDPEQYNGIAAQLFLSDIQASEMPRDNELILDIEASEKGMVLVNERLGLRGVEIDNLLTSAMQNRTVKDEASLNIMRGMTMTVVDGDFPREVLSAQNLTFADFVMAASLNTIENYDTKVNDSTGARQGRLYLGAIDSESNAAQVSVSSTSGPRQDGESNWPVAATAIFAFAFISICHRPAKQSVATK
ncbi:MAG: DUF2330 domain-containing protein [Planctomycetota bacterium]